MRLNHVQLTYDLQKNERGKVELQKSCISHNEQNWKLKIGQRIKIYLKLNHSQHTSGNKINNNQKKNMQKRGENFVMGMSRYP